MKMEIVYTETEVKELMEKTWAKAESQYGKNHAVDEFSSLLEISKQPLSSESELLKLLEEHNLKTPVPKVEHLLRRRGIVRLNVSMCFDKPDEDILRVIFSNFFPFDILDKTALYKSENVKFVGYSPLFRELLEHEQMPEYEFWIKRVHSVEGRDCAFKLDKVTEVK